MGIPLAHARSKNRSGVSFLDPAPLRLSACGRGGLGTRHSSYVCVWIPRTHGMEITVHALCCACEHVARYCRAGGLQTVDPSLAEPRLLNPRAGEGLVHCLRATCSLLQEFLQDQSDCRIVHVTFIRLRNTREGAVSVPRVKYLRTATLHSSL